MARYINAFEFKQKLLAERDEIPLTITQRYSFGVPEVNKYGASVRCGIRKALRCMERTQTAHVVEYDEYRDVVYKLECLLCYATGNRYSKSEYSLQDMERMVDDYVQQLIDEATENTVSRDEYERVCRERDAAIADISLSITGNRFTDPCAICKHKFGEDPCQCLECDEVTPNGNFEWRGVRNG